jgi:hypothetical protein
MKSFNDFKGQINEVLKKSDPIEKWISDFVHSTNPKFAGKSNAERIEMAKGAYYGSQKNEDAASSQNSTPVVDMNEDQYTSEYKIKSYVDPITGENKTRKIRPHRVNFDASKMHSEPAQDDDQGDYGIKESYEDNVDKKKVLNPPVPLTSKPKQVKDFKEGDEYDEKWKGYKGKSFKKESVSMMNFNDFLKVYRYKNDTEITDFLIKYSQKVYRRIKRLQRLKRPTNNKLKQTIY